MESLDFKLKKMNKKINEIKFEEADIAIYHLVFLGNLIEKTISSFSNIIGKVEDSDETVLWESTNSIILIRTISFLDEFDKFVKSSDPDLGKSINDIKKTVKPALIQIKKWKDIREFRNNVLAHNLRFGKTPISIFSRGLGSYDIPQTGADVAVLVSCVSMIKKTFESTFRLKLEKIQVKLDQHSYPKKSIRFMNGKEVESIVNQLTREINDNIFKLKYGNGF
jgi:hypothetical protein